MPVAAVGGEVKGHDHQVALAHPDLAVATRAEVRLGGLIGLDAADLHLAHPKTAHSTRARHTARAANTKTTSVRSVTCLRKGLKPTASVSSLPMETIRLDRSDDGIVTITLDRPEKKNAINAVMWDELLETFRAIADNDEDRVVVITGAGGAFCSGADLSGGNPTGRSRHQLAAMRHVADVCIALHRIPQPTIAKVGGVAAGAGLNMALGCDLIVASDDARFSEIFARRGLTIDFGGSWLLPRLIGMHKAKELALFADIISAQEAAELGIVNRVVPATDLDKFVDDWARRLAAGPPIALAQTKRLLSNAFAVTLEQALEDEGWAQTVNFSTADTVEAMTAFLEKRDPRFSGR